MFRNSRPLSDNVGYVCIRESYSGRDSGNVNAKGATYHMRPPNLAPEITADSTNWMWRLDGALRVGDEGRHGTHPELRHPRVAQRDVLHPM